MTKKERQEDEESITKGLKEIVEIGKKGSEDKKEAD